MFSQLNFKLEGEKEKTYFKAAEERLKKAKSIEDDNLDTIQNGRSKPRIPSISQAKNKART